MGGELDPKAISTSGENVTDVPSKSNPGGEYEGTAFHSQLEYLAQQQQPPQNVSPYGYQPFDMGSMTAALPQPGYHTMNSKIQYSPADAPGVLSPASVYQMQQASQYGAGRGPPFDSTGATRFPQHQYLAPPYGSLPQQNQLATRQPIPIQTHAQYGQIDPYGYGLSPLQIPIDPRFASHGPFGMVPNMQGDPAQFARRASEPAFVPSYPRGPPRKPKQSGYALWVGNLPPAATVTVLKDHFSREATKDIESLFLISKSNCAFVNYRSEAACVAAMNRFHDSRFHGVRLVCRLRRGTTAVSNTASATGTDASETASSGHSPAVPSSPALAEEPSSPTIVGSTPSSTVVPQAPTTPSAEERAERVSEKYFIVKSLTVQDLEASVRNGIWATQSHNEVLLNRAYDEADNVYLVFSANKSGEYFGYARMASPISGEPVNLSSSSRQDEPPTPGAPQSIPTPATATAPKGRIIDDSARGTIFWEAEHSEEEDDDSPVKDPSENASGQNWGRQFAIEWLTTARLPFYRTRGLRNPWNANREVKIARDGTELEPTVGRRLVQMFHRPSPGPAPQTNLPYRVGNESTAGQGHGCIAWDRCSIIEETQVRYIGTV